MGVMHANFYLNPCNIRFTTSVQSKAVVRLGSNQASNRRHRWDGRATESTSMSHVQSIGGCLILYGF